MPTSCRPAAASAMTCCHGSTGMPAARAAASSGWSGAIAVRAFVTASRSGGGVRVTCAGSCSHAIAMPGGLDRRRCRATGRRDRSRRRAAPAHAAWRTRRAGAGAGRADDVDPLAGRGSRGQGGPDRGRRLDAAGWSPRSWRTARPVPRRRAGRRDRAARHQPPSGAPGEPPGPPPRCRAGSRPGRPARRSAGRRRRRASATRDVRQPDRLLRRAAVGPGDPGHGRRDARPEPRAGALGHRPRDLGADRAMRGEDRRVDAEEVALRLVGVGHDAAEEVAARARHGGDRGGDQPAGARLRDRDRRLRPRGPPPGDAGRGRRARRRRRASPRPASLLVLREGRRRRAAGRARSRGCRACRARRATGRSA